MSSALDKNRLLSTRVKEIESSGIREIWALAQSCVDPIDLSIGQPDFHVDSTIKDAAVAAILNDHNGYTHTAGIVPLLEMVEQRCSQQFSWNIGKDTTHSAMVTSGTAGALTLACLTILEEGDEIIIPDPYFIIYPTLARIAGGKAVFCDIYPDFKMTAAKIEKCMTSKTKAVLLNSPANPTGVVLTSDEVKEIADLCRDKGVLLITDEIYDEFVFDPVEHASPAEYSEDVLVIRGFGKTYGCTGWRMGYAAGPTWLIEEMLKLKQQTFVCAPSVMQHALVGAFNVDLQPLVNRFAARRDMVVEILKDVTEVAIPEGAFYAFPKVPEHLGISGTEFVAKCIESNVLVIPGGVFSSRDTHFRISFATDETKLERGLQTLKTLMA